MPRKCTICAHPKRKEIDSALAVDGAILRTIAVRYRINKSSLKRHMDNGHIAEKIMRAQHVHEVIEADSILSQMTAIKKETWIIHKEAREQLPDPDNELALKAITRLEKQIEIESKVLGVTKESTSPPVHVTLNIAEEVKKLVGILPNVKL